LGGATGRGYGAIKIARAATWSADIKETDAGTLRRVRESAFSEHPAPYVPYEDYKLKKSSSRYWLEASLELKPLDVWRIGRGASDTSRTVGKRIAGPDDSDALRDKAPDAVPLREAEIVWKEGKPRDSATVRDAKDSGYIVPGASIKGVLAHRTLFHFNCLNKRWANSGEAEKYRTLPPDLLKIFGTLRSGTGDADDGNAGRLFIDDTVVELAHTSAVAFDHNSIDRFTGGVRNRILFSEEAVSGGKIALAIRLLPARNGDAYCPKAIEALRAAVDDLCQGRLALGAKSLGYCTATLAEWKGTGAAQEGHAA
jgi:CRISPR/Cas system CSM-associated protein Csm3 (group 7 of RAMP superfamily)